MKIKTLAALVLALLASACSKQPAPLEIGNGKLQGFVEDGVEHYLGIPYAQPPVGALRWRPPQAVADWKGVLTVQENPQRCSQFAPVVNAMIGSEDCLYLNVWTPAEKPAAPMPVMVWIHGGGFTAGQGSYGDHDGLKLAADNGVVVVAMNYRLGMFGFLAHQALTAEDPAQPSSGNYGIMDQTAALRWVRDNIRAFGGDPDNVTIFGQSAGGVSVCAQLASAQAAGLFHRAVIQSGPCETPMSTLAAVSQLGEQVAEGVGCSDAEDVLACLRAKPAAEVAAVLPPDPSFAFGEGYTVWWPNLDGQVLPRQFVDAFSSGHFNQVPVINGATRDEATLLIWLSHNLLFKPLKNEQYLARLQYLVGSAQLAEKVAAQYPLERYDSAFDALTASFSDGFFNCFARHQSQALARHVPTWSYQFDYDGAPFFVPGAELRAYHSAEIQYIFGTPMSLTARRFEPHEQGLADSMMAYWVQFARSGNPNGAGLLPWPAYDGGDQTLLFNVENSVAQGVHAADCAFWEGLPYLRPAYQRESSVRSASAP